MPHSEITADSTAYAVNQEPEGAHTLVLVHGAGGNRLHWPGELRRLPGATVYTLDLPGHGRSGERGRDTVEGYAEAVVEFLDRLGIERAVVVGHSMGGAIALTLALGSPDRVAGLVLVASGARLRVAPAILEGMHSDFEGSVGLITYFAWAPEAPPALTEVGRRALLEIGPEVLFGDLAACDRFDAMGRLREIGVPTLVTVGTLDQLTPPKYARFLAEHIPNAQLVLIEGAGHMVMLERPAEMAGAVQEFLKNVTDAPLQRFPGYLP